MKKVPLTKLKDDLSKYLRLAEKGQIVITRHGRPAGILVGFATEDEWFDYHSKTILAFSNVSSRPAQACAAAMASSLKISGAPINGDQNGEGDLETG
jgi:prevent-host-death family protein